MWFYNRCTHVTAPTSTALKLLQSQGLTPPSSIISNGIDLSTLTSGTPDATIRRHFHLPEKRPIAIYVNRLSGEKRVDILLDAATKMQSDGYVVLVGTGPEEALLQEKAKQLHLDDRVSFLGFVSDNELLHLLRSSDVYINPSEAELQSLSTMEAMACGLPIIAANALALPELVYPYKNGFLFQPGHSGEVAHYLDLLLNDKNLCIDMGRESLKIIKKHDSSKTLEEWENLYSLLYCKRSLI